MIAKTTATVLCLMASWLCASASAEPVPGPAGEAFFTPPAGASGPPGQVIWIRERVPVSALASRELDVLYWSTGVDGRPAPVSGVVTLPARAPAEGGWPVLSWAHGTVGIADRCAPSRQVNGGWGAFAPAVDDVLAAGFVITRTDYEGLGTPGTHPYLNGPSEARSVVDLVRAARSLDPRIAPHWVSAGFSQGGQAALFAAQAGPSRAPELRLRGVAPFAPASHIGLLARTFPALLVTTPELSHVSSYAALIIEGAVASGAGVTASEVFSSAALGLRAHLHQRCATALAAADSFGALPPARIVRATGRLGVLHRFLDSGNPAVRVAAPVLLQQGSIDTTVTHPTTLLLAVELLAAGNRVDFRTHPGAGHPDIVSAGRRPFLDFLRQVTRDRAAPSPG